MVTAIILASSSPRRQRLLREAGIDFEVVAPDVDETVAHGIAPTPAAVTLALRKAEGVGLPERVVLAADTLIDLDGRIVGKPADEDDARAILRSLSGRAHHVVTGVAVLRGSVALTGVARTTVTFRELTDAEIAAYVATGEPADKAGAYGIQGGAAGFVAKVDGPMDNVVGLPMGLVRKLLGDIDATSL